MEEIDKPQSLVGRGGFWLKVGNVEVHVGTEDGFNRLMTKSHVAYHVNNLHEWRNKLQKHHIKIIESIAIQGFDRFEFRDPFGNRVEMIQSI